MRCQENDVFPTTKATIKTHVASKCYLNHEKRIIKNYHKSPLHNINNVKDNYDIDEILEGRFT